MVNEEQETKERRNKDFFISYTHADEQWAKWIAQQLEEDGYTTIFQAWDFRAGKSFIRQMQDAMASTRRTIAVLSPGYLAARYTQPEWEDAFRRDPEGAKGILVPVMVEKCSTEGIWPRLVHIDLVGVDSELARERLLTGVKLQYRPDRPVDFPGERAGSDDPPVGYPGKKPTVWNVPFERNASCIPDEKTMKEIKDTLAEGKVGALLSDPKTVGMTTQTAVEFTYRYQSEYDAILWVRASSSEELIADYVNLSVLLNLPERQTPDQRAKIEAVKRWLQTQPDWLLVLANVKDPPLVQSFLPSTYRGHVLITSQELSTNKIGQVIDMRRVSKEENEITHYLSQVIGATLRGVHGKTALGIMGVSIGRDSDNDIVLVDDTVSLHHAEIRLREQGYGITDRSTNGTYVNQKRLQTRASNPLKHKDKIRVGRSSFVYEVGSVLCPQCGTPNSPDAKFCKQDHYELKPAITPDLSLGPQKRCGRCGHSNRIGARFCRNCRAGFTTGATVTSLVRQGDTFYAQKNYQEAYKAYERALQSDPMDPMFASAHFGLGNTLVKLQRYNDALNSYEQAVRINPKDALFHQRKGNAHYLLERYYDALAAYELAIQLDSHLALAYNGKGNVLYKLERYADALNAYQQAMYYQPDSAEAYSGAGNVYQKQENYAEALRSHEKALQLNPRLASAYNGKGNVFYVSGRYKEALDAYDEALKIDDQMVSAHVGRGNTLLKMELYQAALDAYERALKINPKDSNALAGKRMVYDERGNL